MIVKFRFESLQIRFVIGTDEHVHYKMLLPRHFVKKTDLSLRFGIGSTKTVKDIRAIKRIEVIDCLFVKFYEYFRAGRLIHFTVRGRRNLMEMIDSM